MTTSIDTAMGTAKDAIGSARDAAKCAAEDAAEAVRGTADDAARTASKTAKNAGKSAKKLVSFLRDVELNDMLGLIGLRKKRSPLTTLALIGGGMVIGAGIVLLVAPTSGADLRRQIMKLFDSLGNEAKEDVQAAKEKVANVAEDVKEKATEVAGDVKAKAGEVVGDAKSKANELVGEAKDKVGQAQDKVTELVGEGDDNKGRRRVHNSHVS